jgi:hypothetical protein
MRARNRARLTLVDTLRGQPRSMLFWASTSSGNDRLSSLRTSKHLFCKRERERERERKKAREQESESERTGKEGGAGVCSGGASAGAGMGVVVYVGLGSVCHLTVAGIVHYD